MIPPCNACILVRSAVAAPIKKILRAAPADTFANGVGTTDCKGVKHMATTWAMRLFFGGGQPGSQLPPTSTSTSTWPHGQRPRTNTWPGSRSRAHEPSASAPMNTTPGPHRRTPPMDIMPCSARQRATSCDLARARGPERGTGPDPPAPGGANESREPPRPRISAAHLENTEHSGRRKHLSLDFPSPLSPHLLAPGSLGSAQLPSRAFLS